MQPTRHSASSLPVLRRGAVGGMIAAMVMAMFAMIASVTYQHHGFFTPLFHISALFGSPKSMMISVAQAMVGHRLWFAAGPAVVGLMIHMITGAAYGMGFAMLARRIPKSALLPAGAVFGVGVLLVSGLVGLPLAAKITGSGATISDMATMVGWGTFAAEHIMFGVVVALATMRNVAAAAPVAGGRTVRPAMLS